MPGAKRKSKPTATFAAIDRIFADYALDVHAPGLAYGIVAGGRLIHRRGFGVQDLRAKRRVTADTRFRIASMTKAFTALSILALRDDGKLRLDDLAEKYIAEMRRWKYPTSDSPRIRVRDLLNHTSGFVTDDPWGDRQQELPDAEFTRLLKDGVRFSSAPGLQFEYANLGYALLGRIITNVTGRPYAEHIAHTLLAPLGMDASGFDFAMLPDEHRAQGHRWQDNRWSIEPLMGHGAFGAMGGLHTTVNDYAKWVSFLLSAWPARDAPDNGPVRRATIREMLQGSNFPELMPPRQAADGRDRSRRATVYGMGVSATVDPEFGLQMSHGGGYPGFGSFMLLLPEHGIGVFAFANRTYAGPRNPVFEAAALLIGNGLSSERTMPVTNDLARAYLAVARMYEAGNVEAAGDMLAMNFLLDRDAEGRARDLAELKKKVGNCDCTSPIEAKSALEGEFTWRGETGRIAGWILLAPTNPPRIQSLSLTVK